MTPVFADTAFFLALANASDKWHGQAVAFSQENDLVLLTTSWVLTELGDALSRPWHRAVFLRVLEEFEGDPDDILVEADQLLWNLGRDLYADRSDKDWSLTDCISFIVMQQRGLTDALTSDHHFEQAGFNILLK